MSYRCLCGGDRWQESGRVGCIRSRVYEVSVGAGRVEGVFFWGGGGWTDVGEVGGE